MKKIALFISDIEGTLSHNLFSEEEANQSYASFPIILDLIRKKSESDEILFTLSTSGPDELLYEYTSLLAPYFEGTNIKFGNQYSGKHSFDKDLNQTDEDSSLDKVDKIINQVNKLKEEYEITWLGFADDCLCKSEGVYNKLKNTFKDIEIKTFCPIEIVFLISQLSEYLNIPLNELENYNISKTKPL